MTSVLRGTHPPSSNLTKKQKAIGIVALFFLVLSCFPYVARADDPVTGASSGVFSISQLNLFKGTPDPCNGQCDPHAVCTTGGSCICTGGVFEGNGELCCDTSQGLAYDVQDGVPMCIDANEAPSQSPVVGIVPANGWHQLGEDIDGEAPGDESGSSVAMSVDGNRIAIGAKFNDANGATNAGHVRVYEWSGSSWDQLGGDLDGFVTDEYFGLAVALSASGNRVAASRPGYDGRQDRVRVFDWDGSNWLQVGSDIVGAAWCSWSGSSIDLSSDGNRIAIGALNSNGGGTYRGHVRVYNYTNSTSTWVQVGQDIDGEDSEDDVGRAVSLSVDGNRVAVGAPNNDGAGSIAGHVRVFHWNGTTWVQLGEDLDGENAGDYFGFSVALSADGSRLAAGGPYNNETGYKAGHVRVFEWSGDEWVQLADGIDGEAEGDQSGSSVAISADGNRVFIGALYNEGENGLNSGHVRVYDWTGSSWNQTGSDIDGEARSDLSGRSIAASANGARVAIGTPRNGGVNGTATSSGHVRVYEAPLMD